MNGQAHAPRSNCLIQRLLIVHWRLAELSTGSPLSDGEGSDAQVGEEILYFYTSSTTTSQTAPFPQDPLVQAASHDHPLQQEAVAFAGLCKALYTLPEVVQAAVPSSETTTTTQEVFLEHSILTFVPLEGDSIVALVQTGRHGSTPAAVRAAIQRAHQLFIVLRGGGIHKRLMGSESSLFRLTEMQYDQGCRYPGMDLLYQLRKRQDKISRPWGRGGSDTNNDIELQTYQERQQILQEKIQNLYDTLPIATLRRDLRVHYDAFVGELAQRAAINGGVLRSLVEEFPAPMPRPDGSHARYSAPLHLESRQSKHVVQALSYFLAAKTTLREGQERRTTLREGQEPRLLGVSFFFDGTLVSTETGSDGSEFVVSDDTASLILWYMSSFRYQMLSPRISQPSSGTSTPTRRNQSRNQSLPQMIFSLGSRLEDSPPRASFDPVSGDFISPPPLSFLSALDEVTAFDGPSEGSRVWGLPVTLTSPDSKSDPEESDYTYATVSLYCRGDFSFLLYLSLPPEAGVDNKCCVTLFRDFMNHITPALGPSGRLLNGERATSVGLQLLPPEKWRDSRVAIVFVDRKSRKLYLYPGDANQTGEIDQRRNQRSGLKGMFASNRTAPHAPPPRSRSDNSTSLAAFGLDCRYLLASHLALDALLALDEAIDEVRMQASGSPLETCTFLSQRWVYAHADGDGKELYILFDATKYITVADVQKSARDIRKELYGINDGTCSKNL
jgi:hypothetical protein